MTYIIDTLLLDNMYTGCSKTRGTNLIINFPRYLRWIGRSGPVPWPARFPDLTPLDFYLWGRMESLIYETPVESEVDLVGKMVDAAGLTADNTPVWIVSGNRFCVNTRPAFM